MEQLKRKKKIFFALTAYQEYWNLPKNVKDEFDQLLEVLEVEGRLRKPYGKKIQSLNIS